MVAVAGLIAHAIVSASGPEAAVELFIFKQELRSVDKSRIHLIIYRTRSEDMVDTPPLALITVSASDTILSFCSLRKIQDAVLADLTESRTISTIVEIASNQNLGLGVQAMDRINRLAQAISHDFAEGTAIALTSISTGCMNHKNMKCVTRKNFTTNIENITCRTHTIYRRNTDGIAINGSKRKR